ncbi:MAG: 4-(cytidine 5'-diphospho)-2-C-methyl-D-erythritol kinase [Clostridia bacterium]|nr:4-(cytidine 5'-diphospho)-2-C-methyl-D-erythritol kinase [Clostridia bacterium]
MAILTVKAYAKINLHLDVVSKYENGYHEVRNVMQSVSLCDDVEVALNEEGKNSLWCNIPTVPTDEKNIAWRAANLFFEKCGLSLGADIRINKRIPVAAGMAGGSTDGAAVLKALNELCGNPLSESELLELGGRLGADVPFCIKGGTGYADGIGAQLHDFAKMPPCYLVVACGKEGVSTPWAYSTLDALYLDFAEGVYEPADIGRLESALRSGDVRKMAQSMYNIFESAIEPHRPEVTKIKASLIESGALGAMMSGSGPSVFGIFEDVERARAAVSSLETMKIQAFVAEPVKGN